MGARSHFEGMRDGGRVTSKRVGLIAGATPKQGSQAAIARIVIVSRSTFLTSGLIELLRAEADFNVVGKAEVSQDAIPIVKELSADIVLSELAPLDTVDTSGIASLRHACPDVRVVVLTSSDAPEQIRSALDAGVHGYILEDASTSELLFGLRAVLNGERHLSPRAMERVTGKKPKGRRSEPMSGIGITGREREVLTMIAAGHCNKRMAAELDVSVKTVEKHRANLMRKLRIHTVADMTRFAVQYQFVTIDGQRQPRRSIKDLLVRRNSVHSRESRALTERARWVRINDALAPTVGCDALECICPYRFFIERRALPGRRSGGDESATRQASVERRRSPQGRRVSDNG